MKEDWKECKLSEIMTLIGGGTPKTSNPDYWNGEIPWISVKDFNGERRYVIDTEKKITKLGLENSSTKLLSKGDIIISARGTVGELAIIPSDMAFNQSCYGLRAKEYVDSTFLYYLLKQSVSVLQHNTHGSVFDTITRDTFDGITINLPPLATQQKIATILSSLDDKIELNNKINDNLEQQAQAIYDELFNNDDRNIILGDIIETTSGGTPSRKNMAFYTNGNYCWVKSKELQSSFIIDTEEKITDDAINNSAAKLLPKNSVLIAMYGATVGAYGIISKDMTCNQAICALLPNENYPYSYLFMFAKNITHELENLAVGSAQQNISQVLIKKLKVHSDTNKIKEFHSYTHSLFEKKLLIEQENKNLSNLRDTLLPKLMSGEIEVEL